MIESPVQPELFESDADEGNLAIRRGDKWFALTPLDAEVDESPRVETIEAGEEEASRLSGSEKRLPKMLKLLRQNIMLLKLQAFRETGKFGRRVTESEIVERALREYCERHQLSAEDASEIARA